jgi:hypothetical protein
MNVHDRRARRSLEGPSTIAALSVHGHAPFWELGSIGSRDRPSRAGTIGDRHQRSRHADPEVVEPFSPPGGLPWWTASTLLAKAEHLTKTSHGARRPRLNSLRRVS